MAVTDPMQPVPGRSRRSALQRWQSVIDTAPMHGVRHVAILVTGASGIALAD
jgi:hypothetical protein